MNSCPLMFLTDHISSLISGTRLPVHSELASNSICQIQVSCFGGDAQSDTGDHWK